MSAAAAPGGLGAEVDIGGSHFDILSSLSDAPNDGAIHLTADSLTNLDAASLLIGGTRTNNSDGTTTLDVTAQSIYVDNDAEHPLSAPEIVLAVDDQSTNTSASNITLADGAMIIATGTLADQRNGDYIISGIGTTKQTNTALKMSRHRIALQARSSVSPTVYSDSWIVKRQQIHRRPLHPLRA